IFKSTISTVWDKDSSKRIYQFRRLSKKFLIVLSIFSEMVGYLFFAWNFWNSPFSDWMHYFKMFVFLPVLTWYCIFGKFPLGFSFCCWEISRVPKHTSGSLNEPESGVATVN